LTVPRHLGWRAEGTSPKEEGRRAEGITARGSRRRVPKRARGKSNGENPTGPVPLDPPPGMSRGAPGLPSNPPSTGVLPSPLNPNLPPPSTSPITSAPLPLPLPLPPPSLPSPSPPPHPAPTSPAQAPSLSPLDRTRTRPNFYWLASRNKRRSSLTLPPPSLKASQLRAILSRGAGERQGAGLARWGRSVQWARWARRARRPQREE
jgi:hypothetical protein